jgi:hypothetical protein
MRGVGVLFFEEQINGKRSKTAAAVPRRRGARNFPTHCCSSKNKHRRPFVDEYFQHGM